MYENNSKLVSIIVPIYNAKLYLKSCVDSIISQTYKNIEIILVNDGSTDESTLICDNYRRNFKNIKVIHKKNGGVSSARNYGLKEAKGEYITFCDSDDCMHIKQVELLVNDIENTKSDLSCCYFLKGKEKEFMFNNNIKLEIIDKEEIHNFIMYDSRCSGYLWNKLFKKDIIDINNIFFENNVCFLEDLLFVLEYIKFSQKLSFNSNKLYFYRDTPQSIVNSSISEAKLSSIIGLELILENLKKESCDDKLINKVWNELMQLYTIYFWKIIRTNYHNREKWLIRIKSGFLKYQNENSINDSWQVKKLMLFRLMKMIFNYN
ncbi:TPA: glycosyltransferase family 2 protein [Clostridium perfringens]